MIDIKTGLLFTLMKQFARNAAQMWTVVAL